MLMVKLIFTPISPHLTPISPYLTPISPHLTPISPYLTPISPYLTPISPYLTPISPYLTPISPYLRVDVRLPFVYKRYTLSIARSLYADGQVDFHPYINQFVAVIYSWKETTINSKVHIRYGIR